MRTIDIWQVERESFKNDFYTDNKNKVQVIVQKRLTDRGLYGARMWFGKAKNPKFNYLFKSLDDMNRFIKENVNLYLSKINKKYEMQELARKIRKEYKANIKLGDILHYSYGYDCTKHEFYQVINIKGKKITLQEVKQEYRHAGCYGQYYVKPILNSFYGKPFQKILQIDLSNHDKPFEYISMCCGIATNVTKDVLNNKEWLETSD